MSKTLCKSKYSVDLVHNTYDTHRHTHTIQNKVFNWHQWFPVERVRVCLTVWFGQGKYDQPISCKISAEQQRKASYGRTSDGRVQKVEHKSGKQGEIFKKPSAPVCEISCETDFIWIEELKHRSWEEWEEQWGTELEGFRAQQRGDQAKGESSSGCIYSVQPGGCEGWGRLLDLCISIAEANVMHLGSLATVQ